MRCPNFAPLAEDMKTKGIDKERYNFDYNGFHFDVVFSIVSEGYEILVAIHTHNWGCVLNMNKYFYVDMNDDDYFALSNLLNLNWKNNQFNSAVFLKLLSDRAPQVSSGIHIDYRELRQFLQYRHVDDADKIYFCGWNDHKIDNRIARNFDKTEFYLGKTVADYCRKNNISSLWTDIPRDERNVTAPWII